MTNEQYQKEVTRTQGNFKYDEAIKNGLLGLTGEAGEVADYFKKVFYQGHIYNDNEVIKELGDVLWYIAYLSNTLGLSISDVMDKNINKLKKRYPEGFKEADSINREENNNDN